MSLSGSTPRSACAEFANKKRVWRDGWRKNFGSRTRRRGVEPIYIFPSIYIYIFPRCICISFPRETRRNARGSRLVVSLSLSLTEGLVLFEASGKTSTARTIVAKRRAFCIKAPPNFRLSTFDFRRLGGGRRLAYRLGAGHGVEPVCSTSIRLLGVDVFPWSLGLGAHTLSGREERKTTQEREREVVK